jgi:hypothetical protein
MKAVERLAISPNNTSWSSTESFEQFFMDPTEAAIA